MTQTTLRWTVGLTVLLTLPALAAADTASAFVRESDVTSRGTIRALGNTAVNHVGGYAVSATVEDGTGNDISTIYGNASGGNVDTLREEATIGDYIQNSFESFFGMADAGELSYSPSTDRISTGETSLDSVWRDDAPVQSEGDALAGAPGEFSSFNSRPNITADGVPYWVGGITNSPTGVTLERGLFYDGNILLRGGDNIGVPEPIVTGSGIDFDFRFSKMGTNYISPIDVDSDSSRDIVIVVNGSAISPGGTVMREANLVPASVGGDGVENWDNFDFVSINESGDYFVTGDTDGDSSKDEFVFINGSMVLREGEFIGGFLLNGSIEGGMMNENGDWAVIWDVDFGPGNFEALIINGEVKLVEGDLVDWNNDGVVDGGDNGFAISNFTGISSLTLSDRDANGNISAYFTADANNGGGNLEGAFRYTMTIPEPSSALLAPLALVALLIFRRRG